MNAMKAFDKFMFCKGKRKGQNGNLLLKKLNLQSG